MCLISNRNLEHFRDDFNLEASVDAALRALCEKLTVSKDKETQIILPPSKTMDGLCVCVLAAYLRIISCQCEGHRLSNGEMSIE